MRAACRCLLLVAGLLGAWPVHGGEKKAATDLHGDPLPAGALARLGSVRMRHGHNVKNVAFSPDGKTLASAGWDHAVRLWDVETGKLIREFVITTERGNAYSVARWQYCLAFSPDGKRLAVGEHAARWPSQTLRVWDIETGKSLIAASNHQSGVMAVAFNPKENLLASAGAEGYITFTEPTTGKLLRSASHINGAVRAIEFFADGKYFVLAGDGGALRASTTEGSGFVWRRFEGHQGAVESVSLSPDGKTLASAGHDKTVRVWDIKTAKARHVLKGHTGGVLAVRFAPDGKTLASTGVDRTIRIWDADTGKEMAKLEGHHMEVRGLAWHKDGKLLASGAADQTIRLWDVTTGKEVRPQPSHTQSAYAIRFLDDGKTIVTASRDCTARWWDRGTGKLIRTLARSELTDRGAAFSPDGGLLAMGTWAGGLRVFRTDNAENVAKFPADMKTPQSLAYSPDGKLLAAAGDKGIHVRDAKTQEERFVLPAPPDGVKFVRLSPRGELLVIGKKSGSLQSLAKGKKARELDLPFDRLTSAEFSPDGALLIWGDISGTVHLYDIDQRRELVERKGLNGYVQSIAFSADGRTMAAGGWRGITVWEVETGGERRRFRDCPGDAFALAFAPDGNALASGCGDTTVLIWDLTAGAKADGAPVDFAELVKGLGDVNAEPAWLTIRALAVRPAGAVAELRKQLKPAKGPTAKELALMIADLDSDDFDTRQKATRELEALGDGVEGALKKALAENPPLEPRRRLEALLLKMARTALTPERLRLVRAVETLELIATAEARTLLAVLSRGAPGARLTRDAQASLDRLARRKARAS